MMYTNPNTTSSTPTNIHQLPLMSTGGASSSTRVDASLRRRLGRSPVSDARSISASCARQLVFLPLAMLSPSRLAAELSTAQDRRAAACTVGVGLAEFRFFSTSTSTVNLQLALPRACLVARVLGRRYRAAVQWPIRSSLYCTRCCSWRGEPAADIWPRQSEEVAMRILEEVRTCSPRSRPGLTAPSALS